MRILTEIASANLADPFVNPDGKDKPLGPQEVRANFPRPYTRADWRLSQIVDYGQTAVFAGLTQVARYRREWLENFYRVHRDWVEWKGAPYAFVLPADQRDPFAAWELLDILRTGEVEIHEATAPFTAGGERYDAGARVVLLAQPYGAFAKTLLEKQIYPDLRLFPGGPPKPPYDVTTQTLGYLLGVEVEPVAAPFDAPLQLVRTLGPRPAAFPAPPRWAYVFGPESNAGFIALGRLQKVSLPVFRTSASTSIAGRAFAPGTWIVPASAESRRMLEEVSLQTGLPVFGADEPVDVAGFRLRDRTRIGLWRGVRNASGGWLQWLLERYGLEHRVVSAADFQGDLAARYDAIVLPGGIGKDAIVNGLDRARYGEEWAWAFGVGEEGWRRLAEWVRGGGTLVAVGDSVEAARELLDLPLARVLPETRRRRGRATAAGAEAKPEDVGRALKEVFSSPARLAATLRDPVVEPEAQFYAPGTLVQNEFDTAHPIGFGLPARWPVFFESDQAYRLTPSFDVRGEVVARYPGDGEILASGWLLGEDLLRNQANVVAFRVGNGYVVTLGTQVAFRAQPRATYKLLFNAIFHGPASPVDATELRALQAATPVVAGRGTATSARGWTSHRRP